MATKREVERAAKKRWPTSWLEVGYHPSGPSMRQACSERHAKLAEERRQAEAAVRQLKPTLPALLKAARFVVDVHGDPTAVAQLEAALLAAEHAEEVREVYKDAGDVFRRCGSGGMLYYKYRVMVPCAMGLAKTAVAEADSLNELLDKIGAYKVQR